MRRKSRMGQSQRKAPEYGINNVASSKSNNKDEKMELK
jgi:hypothetical protein